MNSVTVDISNAVKALYEMQKAINKDISDKKALKRASKTLVNKLKQNAPKKSGNLAWSFQFLPFNRSKSSVYVGPSYKGKRVKNQENYENRREGVGSHAHLVEYGWTDKYGNRHEGKPFIRTAFESSVNEILSNLQNEAKGIITKVSKK